MNDRHSVLRMQPVDSSELALVEGGGLISVFADIIAVAQAAGEVVYNAAREAGRRSCES